LLYIARINDDDDGDDGDERKKKEQEQQETEVDPGYFKTGAWLTTYTWYAKRSRV